MRRLADHHQHIPWTENFEGNEWVSGTGSGDAGVSHRGTFPHFSSEQLGGFSQHDYNGHGMEHPHRNPPDKSDRARGRPHHWLGHLHLL